MNSAFKAVNQKPDISTGFLFLLATVSVLKYKHWLIQYEIAQFYQIIRIVSAQFNILGNFSSRDVGQMNKYIGYYRRDKQYAHEQDTIGLIICREAGREEVVYALDGLEEKIFIARYKVKLPSEAKIKKALKNI